MAFNSWGWRGTVDELQWAKSAALLGRRTGVGGDGDLRVTQVSGLRRISVAAGLLLGGGITTEASGSNLLDLTTPSAGVWRLVVVRKSTDAKSTSLVAIDGPTTTTAVPTAPPAGFNVSNVQRIQGATWEDALALVWVNSANTTMVIYDLRVIANEGVLCGSGAARDFYNSATTTAAQIALQRSGKTWMNTDTGCVESYYAAYNASSNPTGVRAGVAGWYAIAGQMPAIDSGVSSSNSAASGGWTAKTSMGSLATGADLLTPGWAYNDVEAVPPYSGQYDVMGQVTIAGNASGASRGIRLGAGGRYYGESVPRANPSGSGVLLAVAAPVTIKPGEGISVQVLQDSGASLGVTLPRFAARYLGPA